MLRMNTYESSIISALIFPLKSLGWSLCCLPLEQIVFILRAIDMQLLNFLVSYIELAKNKYGISAENRV